MKVKYHYSDKHVTFRHRESKVMKFNNNINVFSLKLKKNIRVIILTICNVLLSRLKNKRLIYIK